MARTLDREMTHPEVRPDIHPDVHPDVDELIRRTLEEHEAEQAVRRPVRWMRWLTAGFIAVVGIGIAILAMQGGGETEYAVPRSADGTERWLEHSTPEVPVVEAPVVEGAVPRSADGLVGWFEYLTPRVPRTADGTEQWLGSLVG